MAMPKLFVMRLLSHGNHPGPGLLHRQHHHYDNSRESICYGSCQRLAHLAASLALDSITPHRPKGFFFVLDSPAALLVSCRPMTRLACKIVKR